MRLIKKVKTELFYILRLIQEGYGPRYWWSYFKNRFFGNYLFKFLPRCDYVADPDIELHTICSRYGQGLWMFAWMLRSFLFHSKLKPVVIIHDDGTIDKATANLIVSKFPNTKIMFHNETARIVAETPGVPEIIKQVRKDCHFFLDKLIDSLVLSKAKKLIITDSDILYYKPPKEVIDFVLGKSDAEALVQRQIGDEISYDMRMDDFYNQKYNLKEKQIALMNGGYLIVDRERYTLDQLAEYFEHVKMPFTDYFIEMSGWACLLAQVNFKFLDPQRYAIKGFLNDKMVMKHYTSPRRYEMFAYGIDKARKLIGS